jgi:TolB protein
MRRPGSGAALTICVLVATTVVLAGMTSSGWGASAGVARYLDPAWSPDGRRIAFVKWAPYPRVASAIYVINRDGTGLRRLRGTLRAAGSPTWSPDGRRIAFSEARGMYVMNSNGSGLHLICGRWSGEPGLGARVVARSPTRSRGRPPWSPVGSP